MGVVMGRVQCRYSPYHSELLNLIARTDKLMGAWRVLGRLRLTVLRQLATLESIGSSTRIEGRQLTDQEVERLLSALS